MENPTGLGMPLAPAQPTAPQAMPTEQEMTAGTVEASPEEQEMYDTFVSMALLALYDDKMMPKTVAHLKKQQDKAAAVGEIAAGIFQRVYASAREAGTEVPGDVLINALSEIVEGAVELSDAKAGTDLQEADIEDALYKALDIVRKAMDQSGAYTDDMKGADAMELQSMSQSGEIDAITGGSGRLANQEPAQGAMPPGAPPVGM